MGRIYRPSIRNWWGMSGVVGNWTFASRVNQDGKSGTGVFNLPWYAPGLRGEWWCLWSLCGDIRQVLRGDGRQGG
jgi:hypothetical protein